MGNYKRIYGNGIFVTKLNAKELILKKINADTNWVDIYTSGVILGEDINNIGNFMTSQVINDLVSKYNTSAFDTEYVGTKIDFIRKAIASETDSNKIAAYNELLRRVYIAEELRILGKILKINQGMPTNFSDLQQYISSIEEYIESRLNHVNLENYQNTISQFAELKIRLGLSEKLTEEEMNIPEVTNALKQIKNAKKQMTSNWIYFNLVKFVQDKEYAHQMDAMYEGVKVTFNILNTLRNSPHFSEMFNVLGLNNTILTSLSKRNLIERTIWNNAAHKSSRGQKVIYKKINSTEKSTLKTLVDDTLADTWIKTNIRNSDGSPVRIIWIANEKSNVVTFDGGFDYKLFIKYIETELIPRLRNNGLVVNGRTINTADNAFIKHLTFGKDRDGNTIFRLPYNMTQIDKNPGIQMEYEKILSAFGQLRGIILDNGLSIVDMFYLYNLIIHKDKINSRYSLTRLFEDLIASDGGEQLLVFKFNEWLETVNENEIINKVLGNWGAIHSNDNIGNSNASSSNLGTTTKFTKLSNQSSPKVEIYQGYWTREEVESQTDKVFLFGDNTDDRVNTHYVPTRTQAVIRGLDNAIGIDTKKNRGTSESSYFTDVDFDIFKAQVDEAIQHAINSGKTIVIPADGIGTGKAELEKRAPKVFAYLQQRLDELKNLSSTSPVQFDDSIDISEESIVEEPVTIGFDNTSDRVSEEPDESNYIEPIRRLQLLDDYYRPIFTSEELISFEEDAKRIFDNKSILNERVNIHYSEWKILNDITDMRRWEKIWEDIVYDGNAEESENDFKYNNKSKTVQIPKYIYDRIKLYQKYQKLVDFLMGIAQKNNYYDYYGNLFRHDEDWFGDIGSTSLDILKDLYDLAGIKEIYDDPNQLKLFDSLHINSDYIADSTPVYQTTPSKQSKLIEVVRQANEKGIKGLHAVYQSDLVNEDIYIRSANGFVRNGEIYINVDRAGDDTVIHEFGHLYLADAKNNNRLAYYALLEKVKDTELWKRMRTWEAYANKIGSDFDEEILATMIGEYYKLGFENYEYKSLVKEALELVDPAFIELLNSEILPDLGDTFITNYHFQQKVATWKSKLVSDNILKENCL